MKSLEKFVGDTNKLTFAKFRKFILNRYKKQFNEIPAIRDIIKDVDYEGTLGGLGKLSGIYFDTLEELNFLSYDDFLENLDTYINDFFIEMGFESLAK